MSLVSEIKCARCDRKYSGVRSRCPYCGARRIGQGKYTEDSDNAKGKMLISILIMGVLVVGAGVLLLTSPIDADAAPPATVETPPTTPSSPEDDIESRPGLAPRPQPRPPEDEDEDQDELPAPVLEVRSVTITHNNSIIRNNDFTQPLGQPITLGVRIEPPGIEEDIIWTSSDESVFSVVALNPEGTQARVTGIARGHGTLTVSVGGVEATCTVRISG